MQYGRFKTVAKAASWAAAVISGSVNADNEDFELAFDIIEDLEGPVKVQKRRINLQPIPKEVSRFHVL